MARVRARRRADTAPEAMAGSAAQATMSSGSASGRVSVQLSNVGKSNRTNARKVDINIDIKLKRTSSVVESAKLMDEFLQLIDRDIPDLATKLIRKL